MKRTDKDIYPIYSRLLTKKSRDQLLDQVGCVIWLTGLSGSGKSTIAIGLEQRLYKKGYKTFVLDGDNVRDGLCGDLGFSVEEREENIRRVAEVARLFSSAGLICICSFVSPTNFIRDKAKKIIGEDIFVPVYIKASLDTCENRDVKGLYKKARRGEIKDFTGIDSPFEEPGKDFLIIDTEVNNVDQCVELIMDSIKDKISL